MATKTKQWAVGGGSATIQYDGQGDGNIIITSDANSLYGSRSMQITVETVNGSPKQTKTVTINQAAKQRIDLSAAMVTASNQTYSGSAKTPTPTVTLNGSTVPSNGYDVTYSNNTNAGTATITVTGKGDYTGTATGTFTIAKAAPTYTAPAALVPTYNRGTQNLVSAGSSNHGVFTYATSKTGTYSNTIPQGTNAGSYTVWWKFTGDSNHTNIDATQVSNVSIVKATPVLSTSPSLRTGLSYTGSAQNLLSGGAMKHSSSDTTAVAGTFTYAKQTNAGTYNNPTWSFAPTDTTNYNSTSGSVAGSVSIAKIAGATGVSQRSLTYSRGMQNLVTVSGNTGTNHYKVGNGSWSTTVPTATTAGTYTIYVYTDASTNYNAVGSSSSPVTYTTTIAKATPVVNQSPAKVSNFTYDGSAHNLLSGGSMKYSSSDSTAVAGSFSYAQATNAGTYSNLTWGFIPTDTTNYNNVSGTVSGSVVVSKATGSATVSGRTVTYSRGAQNMVSVSGNTGTMHYRVGTSGSWTTVIPTRTNAGSDTIYWYMDESTNYTAKGSSSNPAGSVTGTVSKATPILATSPTYRTGLTYTGSAQNLLSGGSMKHSLSDTTTVSGTFTYDQGTNAGNYSNKKWYFAPTDTTNYNSTNGTVTGSASIAKASRTLSFADSYMVLNTSSNATKTATPSAGSGDGAITYSIANTTYATINSSTGAVTTKTSDGSVIVTATIGEGTNYLSASASYTLYVFATTHNYSYSGSAKNVTLPPGTYQFQCWGAQGASCSDGYSGGKGGYSVGQLTIANALAIQVLVGGQNGYNGGGSSSGSSSYNSGDTYGRSSMGNGGGASDIRLSDGALLSRMIVAGGGSGGAYCYKKVTTQVETTIASSYNDAVYLETARDDNSVIWAEGYSAGKDGIRVLFSVVPGQKFTASCIGKGVIVNIYDSYNKAGFASSNYLETFNTNYYTWSTSPVSGTVHYAGYLTINLGKSDNSNFTETEYYSYLNSLNISIKETTTETTESDDYQTGYAGGGTTGAGYSSTYQGKQNAAGSGGSFGQGPNQTITNYRFCSGAGGGGWYGGGGGEYSDYDMNTVHLSGGGSGFVNTAASAGNRPSGYTGLELDNGTLYAGNQSFPAPGGGNETGHSGDGYVRITRLS